MAPNKFQFLKLARQSFYILRCLLLPVSPLFACLVAAMVHFGMLNLIAGFVCPDALEDAPLALLLPCTNRTAWPNYVAPSIGAFILGFSLVLIPGLLAPGGRLVIATALFVIGAIMSAAISYHVDTSFLPYEQSPIERLSLIAAFPSSLLGGCVAIFLVYLVVRRSCAQQPSDAPAACLDE